MKFLVYAPGDYTPNGGGCVALHKLCHNLAVCGEDAYIFTSKKNPNYLGTEVNLHEAIKLAKQGAFVIYPEVTCDNPFGAFEDRIMRWILYYVRDTGRHGIFDERNLIYKYADHFTLRYPEKNKVHGELRAVELNLDVFYNRNEARSGSCFLVKKNPDKAHIHPSDSLKLDNYPNMGGNPFLAEVFNKKEIFYAYDSATWLSIMAALCGCVSVVIPDEGVTADEWHSKFPYFKYGIAYGEDDMEYAQATVSLVRDHLIKIEAETMVLTKAFIERAKAHVG